MPNEVKGAEACGRCCRKPVISPDLPEILSRTAQVLRDNGCGETVIRAALLSLCGLEVRGMSLSALCVY